MSLGLRATVLAGVAAALLAVLIPITPLAIGTQEQPEDGPEGTTGEPNGAPAGQYSTGAAPIAGGPIQPVLQLGEGAEPGTIADEPQAAPARPLSPANGGGTPAPAPSGSSTAAEAETPTDTTPVTDPVADPGPAPDPSPQPVPDPSPQPVPDPVPDPTPDPEPSPEPAPDPVPDPTPVPDPAPAPTEPAPSVP